MAIEPGQTLLHYRLVEKIGEGGMGAVWKAVDTTLEREVAIKILPAEFARNAERLARFEREAKLLASLNHPNIATIHGLHQDDRVRFLVMELVSGQDLHDRLKAGPMTLAETIDTARQIAEALETAHESGIVHRDLKPANVVLTPEGQVKVLDFGLAKALAASESEQPSPSMSPTVSAIQTQAGVILGTAAYMSPEQARGKRVDPRTDVWAFGCVLYEMLAGRHAFRGDNITDILAAIVTREPDFDDLPEDLPASVGRVVRRCLVKNPRDRLQAIGDARIELQDVDQAQDELATSIEPSRPRRMPFGWIAVAVLVSLSIGAVAGLFFAPTPGPAEPIRIRALTFGSIDYAPTASPDGKLIAYTSHRGGASRIWLKQLAGGGERPLTEGPDSLPQFSSDGSSVLFIRGGDERRSAYRLSIVGGQPRRIVDNVIEATWSPDDGEIAFIRGERTSETDNKTVLGVVSIDGGPERILLEVNDTPLRGCDWSPDGSSILVTRNSASGGATGWQALLVDVADGTLRKIGPPAGLTMISAGSWAPDGSSVVLASIDNTIGNPSGVPSRVARYEVEGDGAETLFWWSGLFPHRGSGTASARFDALGDGKIVFDTYEQRQTLLEVSLRDAELTGRTRGTATDRQPAFSPDGRQVVFSSNRAGNLDLWRLDLENGELTQVTDDTAQDWDPAFTPDGKRVLYSSDRGGNLEIWMADTDGGNPRQVSHDGVDAENPTMTADGRWIVYCSGSAANPGIFRIRPDGSEVARIAAGTFVVPEVSPDGRFALYSRAVPPHLAEVFVVEIESGETVDFRIEVRYPLDTTNVMYGRGRWMPGGDAIAFVGVDDQGRTGVYVQDFAPGRDTSATRRPLAGFFDDDITESFTIAPDGSRVILATIQESRSVMLAEGVAGF